MAFCASLESNASLRGSPPVPALVCFFIASEDLEAGAGEVGGKGGEACLATLLALVNDREPYFGNKVRDSGIGGA